MTRRPKPLPQSPPLRYAAETLRPWPCLVFLLPLIAIYEIGLVIAHPSMTSDERPGLAARELLQKFFGLFGATGYYLPGAALVAVLLAWHIFARNSWRINPWVPVGMAAESILWACRISHSITWFDYKPSRLNPTPRSTISF